VWPLLCALDVPGRSTRARNLIDRSCQGVRAPAQVWGLCSIAANSSRRRRWGACARCMRKQGPSLAYLEQVGPLPAPFPLALSLQAAQEGGAWAHVHAHAQAGAQPCIPGAGGSPPPIPPRPVSLTRGGFGALVILTEACCSAAKGNWATWQWEGVANQDHAPGTCNGWATPPRNQDRVTGGCNGPSCHLEFRWHKEPRQHTQSEEPQGQNAEHRFIMFSAFSSW